MITLSGINPLKIIIFTENKGEKVTENVHFVDIDVLFIDYNQRNSKYRMKLLFVSSITYLI